MTMQFKQCPRCGQPNYLEVSICARCRHQFATQFTGPAPRQRSRGFPRLWVALAVVSVLVGLLALNNPGKDEYTTWMTQRLTTEKADKSPEDGMAMALAGAMLQPMLAGQTRSTNLVVFSVFETYDVKGGVLCIAVGILNRFVPIRWTSLPDNSPSAPPEPTPLTRVPAAPDFPAGSPGPVPEAPRWRTPPPQRPLQPGLEGLKGFGGGLGGEPPLMGPGPTIEKPRFGDL